MNVCGFPLICAWIRGWEMELLLPSIDPFSLSNLLIYSFFFPSNVIVVWGWGFWECFLSSFSCASSILLICWLRTWGCCCLWSWSASSVIEKHGCCWFYRSKNGSGVARLDADGMLFFLLQQGCCLIDNEAAAPTGFGPPTFICMNSLVLSNTKTINLA